MSAVFDAVRGHDLPAASSRAWALTVAAFVAACGGGGGPGAGSPADEASGGDAARILCEAECRRDDRCGREPAAECLPRCATLPVRRPAIWSVPWARQIATCFADIDCGHDREETCILRTSFHTEAGATCRARGAGNPRACQVLDGLTPGADRATDECLRGGGDAKTCSPEYDWK